MNVYDLVASISLDLSQYNSGLAAAQAKMATFGHGLTGVVGGIAGTLGKIALGGVAAATTAVVAFGKSSLSVGMQFDQAMSGVAATLGKTVDDMNSEVLTAAGGWTGTLRDFALKLGSETAFTATQAAQALNYMALAGYTAQQSVDMLPTVLHLASAGGMDLARASDMVTDAQSALGLSFDETTGLVNKMALAASKTNTSVEQLGDAILTVGGTAKNMSGGTTELVEVLGLLADNGIKGSEGGTHLRNMLLKLASPTKDGTKALQALNLSIFDANGNMRSFSDIFLDMNAALSQFTQEERLKMISDMFNARDIAAVEALLGTSAERWGSLAENIDAAGEAADEMANTKLDNLAGDITIFKSALEGAKIAISDQLSPALRLFVQDATKGISSITTGFKEDGIQGAAKALGTWLAGVSVDIAGYVPGMVSAGASLLSGLIEGLVGAGPELVDAFGRIAYTAATSFVGLINQLITPGINGIIDDINYILGTNIPHIPDITLPTWEELTGKENLDTIKTEAEEKLSGIEAKASVSSTPNTVELDAFVAAAQSYLDAGAHRVTVTQIGVDGTVTSQTEVELNDFIANVDKYVNSGGEAGGKVVLSGIGVDPSLGFATYQIDEFTSSVESELNAKPLKVKELGIDGRAGEPVIRAARDIVVEADSTLNGEGTSAIKLTNIGVDVSALATKKQEIVESIKQFWSGPDGVWTQVTEFFDVTDEVNKIQNGFNSLIDIINSVFGTNIDHVGMKSAENAMKEIDSSATLAESYVEKLKKLQEQFGAGAKNTAEWADTIGRLKQAIPDFAEVFGSEDNILETSNEKLRENIELWKQRAKVAAITSGAQEYYELMAEAAKRQVKAGYELDRQTEVMNGYEQEFRTEIDTLMARNDAVKTVVEGAMRQIGIGDYGTASTQQLGILLGVLNGQGYRQSLAYAWDGDSGNRSVDWNGQDTWQKGHAQSLKEFEAANEAYKNAKAEYDNATSQLEDATKNYEEYSARASEILNSATESAAQADSQVLALSADLNSLQDKDIYIRAHIIKPNSGSAEDLLNIKHIDGTHASGLNYVPYDGYLAELHRGEEVLNSADAEIHRNGGGGINTAGLASEIAGAVKSALEGVGIYMGAERVADLVTERVSQNIADEARDRRYA